MDSCSCSDIYLYIEMFYLNVQINLAFHWVFSPFSFLMSRLRHQARKELYAYKQVILKEKVKELNLYEICAVCLEEFKPKDELGICPCKHAFHRKCLIKWLEVRKVCPLCNMPVLQLAQLHSNQEHRTPQGPLPGAENIV
ncbi:hypothetical protein GDO86_000074 [Hymenochirus boettgeri]|uniref:RING finger protein 24 n=1 Tax=Hymenochirus boettgeri TaxID=247094 RepID=A0A8T2K9L0_9PIPI|nr:hypothetical protein GDO86_000074 [Hymenochirus boettgeri]